MVDLCVGPHIPSTNRIKAFMVTKVSIMHVNPLRNSHLPWCRVLRRTSSVIPRMIRFNEFTVSRSQARNSLMSTKFSLLRLRSGITGKLAKYV